MATATNSMAADFVDRMSNQEDRGILFTVARHATQITVNSEVLTVSEKFVDAVNDVLGANKEVVFNLPAGSFLAMAQTDSNHLVVRSFSLMPGQQIH